MKLMGLAGFSLGEADIIRRYMSKKKVDKFVAYKDKFIDGLVARGAKRSDAASFWDELVAFSEYAFNKSHSRAYSEVAYATAYLKYHYPEAYTVGLLNYTASDKREAVLTEAKNSGIKISVPDINIAEETFILSGKEVVYGLSSITQVAASAGLIVEERKKNGKFVSFTDFVKRCSLKKNVTENLIKAGAFDSLHESRQALLIAYPVIAKALETIEVKEQKLLTEVNDKKRIALTKTLEDAKHVLSTPLSDEYEDSLERLMAERDVLGYFISDHPISDAIKECIKLKDFDKPFGDVIVFINSVEFKKSKAGRPYARVLCEDNTGSLNCVVFERTLDNIKQVLKEGSILKLSVSRKEDSNIINKAVSYR